MPLRPVSAEWFSAISDQGKAGVLLHLWHGAEKIPSAGHPAYDS